MRKMNAVNFDVMLRDGRLAVPPLEIRVLASRLDTGGMPLSMWRGAGVRAGLWPNSGATPSP